MLAAVAAATGRLVTGQVTGLAVQRPTPYKSIQLLGFLLVVTRAFSFDCEANGTVPIQIAI